MKKLNKYFLAVLAVSVLIFLIKEAMGNGDFKVFLEASKIVLAGNNPYNNWIFISEGNYCLYFYSPLWTVILSPFTALPSFIPNFIWLAASCYFLYRSWVLLKQYINVAEWSEKQGRWLLILTLLMSIRFILYNFQMIQMTTFILWACLESLHLIRQKKIIGGGLLLALVINIKILPIVLIPYLIYRSYVRAAVSVILYSFVLLLLPALFVGWTQNLLLLKEWWSVINPAHTEQLIETELGVHSLTALIPSLLTKTENKLNFYVNLFEVGSVTTIYILNAIRLFLIFLTLYFLKWPPFKKASSRIQELRELAFILLLIPLIFPHQQKYAFLLAIPAQFYLSYFMVKYYSCKNSIIHKPRWFFLLFTVCFSFILMTLSSDGLIGKNWYTLSQHYKLITWGALTLIVSLIMLAPKRIINL